MKTELRKREDIPPIETHRVENACDPVQWPDAELSISLKGIFPPITDIGGTIKKLRGKELYLLAPGVAKKPLSHLPPLPPKPLAPVAAAPASKLGGSGGGGQGNSSDPRVYVPTEQEEKEIVRKIELAERNGPRPFIAPPPPQPAVDPRAQTPFHNDATLIPDVEKGSFKTDWPVDMNNLSPEENAALNTMVVQGRKNPKDQKMLLDSGSNFKDEPMQKGDKLYAFDSAGHEKPHDSMYWLTEKDYGKVKASHCKDGAWDREGVKNELALPCYNRANTVVQSEVLESHTALRSDIAPATERVCYTGDNKTTGMYTKPMPGGGAQTTPSATKISKPKVIS